MPCFNAELFYHRESATAEGIHLYKF